MTTRQRALNEAIRFQAAELRDGMAAGETKAEIHARKVAIAELERQLHEEMGITG